jgi:hypothetical protein
MIMQAAQPPEMAAIHCSPVADTTRANVRIEAGRYLLVVESKQGRAQGMLQLWPTSPRDRSPTHPSIIPPAGGFAGTLGPWGIVGYGRGHFCAFRALNRSP